MDTVIDLQQRRVARKVRAAGTQSRSERKLRRYLVLYDNRVNGVAHDTLIGSADAWSRVGPCSTHVVVLASPPSEGWIYTKGDARVRAARTLHSVLAQLKEKGVRATGEVGEDDAMSALTDVAGRQPYDHIVLVVAKPHITRWVQNDVRARVERCLMTPTSYLFANV